MTSTEFNELILRLETESLRSPGTYRAKLVALTALGHLYVIALLVLMLVLLALATVELLNGNLLETSGRAISGLIAGGLCLAATRLRLPHPEGRRLLRSDAPQLFAVIDKIRNKLGAPSIHQVVVNDVFSAAILQAPRLGIFGWNHNTLVVGLPLMQALSRKEFAAILAHEYAHISRLHGRLEAWIHRTQVMWKHVGNGLNPHPGRLESTLTGFLRWYIPILNAFGAVHLRQDELEADFIAASVVGHQTMADALIAQALRGRFLEERFWQGLWSRADHQPTPPFLPHTSMRTALSRGISAEESLAWLMETMKRDAAPNDTYPGLRERILALDTGTELPPDAIHSAAQSLLGDLLPDLQKDFDARWLAHNSQAWRLRFHAVTSARETVHRMEHRSVEQLSPEELAHLGLAFDTLGRSDEALPLLRLAAEHPNGPAEAALATARLLRARNDCSATHYMETALRRNPGLARHRAEQDALAGLAAIGARHARQHAA
jgi:Zn-dependent protease with chaperone function